MSDEERLLAHIRAVLEHETVASKAVEQIIEATAAHVDAAGRLSRTMALASPPAATQVACVVACDRRQLRTADQDELVRRLGMAVFAQLRRQAVEPSD